MRKLVTIAAAATLVAGLLGPGQTAPRPRTESQDYSTATGFVIGPLYGHQLTGDNLATFTARPGEKWVSVAVDDATGLEVHARALLSAPGSWSDSETFCTATDRPLRIRPGTQVQVATFVGSCADGTPSIVTTGTVTATFSK